MKTKLPLFIGRRCAQKLGVMILEYTVERRGICHQCGEHRPIIHRDDIKTKVEVVIES